MHFLNMMKDSLVHLAALTTLAGFFFREQLVLRGLFMLGTLFYIAFYLFVPEQPLWNAIFWNALLVLVNLIFLYLVLRDRRFAPMTDREKALFDALRLLSPGQFRRLARTAEWKIAGPDCVLTVEGESVASLYFVFSGETLITKAGTTRTRPGQMFIGEIAFLRKRQASATVKLKPGANYVEWSSSTLRRLLDRDEPMRVAVLSVLNRDLADKVALS